MSTLEIINTKIDNLGGEMKAQTQSLIGIELNTKSMAAVELADQEARDRIYNRLADGLLKLARVISCGLFLFLLMAAASFFRQELHASIGDNSIDMGSSKSVFTKPLGNKNE